MTLPHVEKMSNHTSYVVGFPDASIATNDAFSDASITTEDAFSGETKANAEIFVVHFVAERGVKMRPDWR